MSFTRLNGNRLPPLAKQERILKPKEEALPPPTAKDLGPSLTMLTLCNQISAETLVHPKLTPTLQAIKGALFEREYTRAFGSPEYLRAYVARWVPSRALAYRQMFGEEVEEVRALFEPKEGETKRRLRGVRVDKVVEEPKEEDEDESNEDDENEPEEPQPDPDSEDDEEPSKRDINIVCVGAWCWLACVMQFEDYSALASPVVYSDACSLMYFCQVEELDPRFSVLLLSPASPARPLVSASRLSTQRTGSRSLARSPTSSLTVGGSMRTASRSPRSSRTSCPTSPDPSRPSRPRKPRMHPTSRARQTRHLSGRLRCVETNPPCAASPC